MLWLYCCRRFAGFAAARYWMYVSKPSLRGPVLDEADVIYRNGLCALLLCRTQQKTYYLMVFYFTRHCLYVAITGVLSNKWCLPGASIRTNWMSWWQPCRFRSAREWSTLDSWEQKCIAIPRKPGLSIAVNNEFGHPCSHDSYFKP